MKKRLITGLTILLFSLLLQGFSLFTDAGKTGNLGTISVNNPEVTLGSRSSAPDTKDSLVTRVVDGDTIIVLINGVSEKVRLIGVDTPETVDPRRPVQCFGKEASAFTKALLENKLVRLETDSSQGDKDKYGRLLRYVYLGDILVNEKIIAEGYGHEYTYRTPYRYQSKFKLAQKEAEGAQNGLWAPATCAGLK